MLHFLMELPALTAFGKAAALAMTVMLVFWCAAFGVQLVVSLSCRRRRWLSLVPLLAGAVGVLMTLMMRIYPVDLPFILLFWGGYALALLCGWGVSAGIARLIRAWKQSTETKPQ